MQSQLVAWEHEKVDLEMKSKLEYKKKGLIYQTELIPKSFVHKKCGTHESPVKKKKKSYSTRTPESGQIIFFSPYQMHA